MKNLRINIAFFIAIGIAITTYSHAQEENPFSTKWENGYQLASTDGEFKLKFGGRIMWDNALFFQDEALENTFGELNNGTQFRRVRLNNEGEVYNNVKYKLQLDFAGGAIGFRDVFIELKKIAVVGNMQLGQHKEPFGLEQLTSSNNITFIERALPIDLAPARNTGLKFHDEHLNKRLSWQAGFYRNADGAGNDRNANDGYNITARVTGLPLMNNDKSRLLHLGLAYSYRKPLTRSYRLASRPEAHLGNNYISTGTIADINAIHLAGTELALVIGSFSVQGEFIQSMVSTKTDTISANYVFSSSYSQISYFITGEKRNYKSSHSGFDRLKPTKNFGSEGGVGAWEIALRYSASDFNSGNIQGGQLNCVTLGVNCYLNPVTRIMTNYGLAQLKDTGNAGILQLRFQVDF